MTDCGIKSNRAIEQNFKPSLYSDGFFPSLSEKGMWGRVYFHIRVMHIYSAVFVLTFINVKISRVRKGNITHTHSWLKDFSSFSEL